MEQQLCTMCSNVSIVLCKTCKSAAYCSTECLKADMPIHQILCGELQPPPNDAAARRGIFFPVDGKAPRFVWVTTKWREPEDGDPGWEDFELKPYIGEPDFHDKIRIWGNYIRSRPRHDQIMVFMRDTCLIDGSKPNSSIAALITDSKGFYSWRGGMLAMKLPTLKIDPGRYTHMNMVDFRDVVDLFRSYGSDVNMSDEGCNQQHKGPVSPLDETLKRESNPTQKNLNKPATQASSSSVAETLNNLSLEDEKEVLGVRINCCGDRKSGRAQFEPIKVLITDPVWTEPIPGISKLVGLPIRVRRIPSEVGAANKSKRRKKPTFDEANQAATFLHMNVNPNAKDWGWASPFEWQMPTGSVVVVHANKKDLLPQHVEALCHLCQYVMQPVFEDSIGAGLHPENPIPKRDVLRRLTPREFELFYSGFTSWKRDNDPKYREVNLPS